MPSTRT